jgi:hypothetical protein
MSSDEERDARDARRKRSSGSGSGSGGPAERDGEGESRPERKSSLRKSGASSSEGKRGKRTTSFDVEEARAGSPGAAEAAGKPSSPLARMMGRLRRGKGEKSENDRDAGNSGGNKSSSDLDKLKKGGSSSNDKEKGRGKGPEAVDLESGGQPAGAGGAGAGASDAPLVDPGHPPRESPVFHSKFHKRLLLHLALCCAQVAVWVIAVEVLCLYGAKCGSGETGDAKSVKNGGGALAASSLVVVLVIVPTGLWLMSQELRAPARSWALLSFLTAVYLAVMSFVFFAQASDASKQVYSPLSVHFYGSQAAAADAANAANISFGVFFLIAAAIMLATFVVALTTSRLYPNAFVREPAFTLLSAEQLAAEEAEAEEKRAGRSKKKKRSSSASSKASSKPQDDDHDGEL